MHIKPKKRLGQNFLFDKNILRKIIESCELIPEDTVLEIGAGKGGLTELISQKVSMVYALEIDRRLNTLLSMKFNGNNKIEIINQDILKFNLGRYPEKLPSPIKVIGNIPYYITTPIIEYLFNFRDRLQKIFLTVQKEFAKRMIASSGSKDYSAFSCFVQYYSQPEILFEIKRSCFSPAPKVDSVLLRLEIKKELPLNKNDEEQLFKIIRASFNQRRKTLRNSLKGIIPAEKLEQFLLFTMGNPNLRAEDLALEDFMNLL